METRITAQVGVVRTPNRVGGCQAQVDRTVLAWDRNTQHVLEVGAGESAAVNAGSISSLRFVYVEAAGRLLVRTTAADGDPIAVAPPETGAPGLFMLVGEAAGLWLENEGSAPVTAIIVLAGME